MARLKNIEILTLGDIFEKYGIYCRIPDGLMKLSCPGFIRVGILFYEVPQTMKEFTEKLCYGQRLFLSRNQDNDIDLIIRMIAGYYYPLVTHNKWDEDRALVFQKKILSCKAIEVYPVAMHFVNIIAEITGRESELLHRAPSKLELAAGIEKLGVFAELNALSFLSDVMKCSVPEVLLTPYNECLVRFMNAKELADYQDRYFKLQQEQYETKSKYKK